MRALPSPGVNMPAIISADVKAFLSQPHVAALATVRPDGRPHVTPVWYDFDGHEFTVSTFRTTQKLKNVARKGFASLCVFTPQLPGRPRRPPLRPGHRRLGRHRHPPPPHQVEHPGVLHRLERNARHDPGRRP